MTILTVGNVRNSFLGCDIQSCYFIETTSNVVPFSSVFSPVTNLKARKIVQYTYLPGPGDTSDEVEGHGTHVSATIVGNIPNSDITQGGLYNGKYILIN